MSKGKRIKENYYLQLFFEFFKLGTFTIGGGMAMVPLIQTIVVDKKGWMTEEEVVDCIAISQGLPGVIAINMATYIGRQKKGLLGALCATAGVIMPSFFIIIMIVELLQSFEDNRYFDGAMAGMKGAAVGLIAYSAYKIGRKVLNGVFSWTLAIIGFAGIVYFDIHAVWIILAGIFLGVILKRPENKGGDGGEGQ